MNVQQESAREYIRRIIALGRCPYVFKTELERLAGHLDVSLEAFLNRHGLSTGELENLVVAHFKHVAYGCLCSIKAAQNGTRDHASGRFSLVQLKAVMEHGQLSPEEINTSWEELRYYEREFFPEKEKEVVVKLEPKAETAHSEIPTGLVPATTARSDEERYDENRGLCSSRHSLATVPATPEHTLFIPVFLSRVFDHVVDYLKQSTASLFGCGYCGTAYA